MRHIFLFSLIILTVTAYSQNEKDVLRYSTQHYQGSARFNGMAGAFGALGGDLTSITINPAGLGAYNKSEISFTPGFHLAWSSGTYKGQTYEDGRGTMIIPQVGFAWAFEPNSVRWSKAAFSVGYNRLANFNNRVYFTGKSNSSLLDGYISNLNSGGGINPGNINSSGLFEYDANLAYQTYLINPTMSDSTQYEHVLKNSTNINQEKTIVQRGGIGETYIAFGSSYMNKLYLGASVGFPTIKFSEETIYKETSDKSDTLTDLKNYSRNDDLITRGNGINFKFGLIYRPIEWIRLGAAVHSPNFYGMSDTWSARMNSEFKDGANYDYTSKIGLYDYNLITPTRLIGSMGIVIARTAVLSADYEYVDYSVARLKSSRKYLAGSYSFQTENNTVQDIYMATHNIRVGTEVKLEPVRLRAGYGYNMNPFAQNVGGDNSSQTYSAGIGIKEDGYFIDLGYALTQANERHYLYSTVSEPADIKTNNHFITLTVGFQY